MNLVNEVLVENFVEDEDDFNNFISKPITNGKNMILQYMYVHNLSYFCINPLFLFQDPVSVVSGVACLMCS